MRIFLWLTVLSVVYYNYLLLQYPSNKNSSLDIYLLGLSIFTAPFLFLHFADLIGLNYQIRRGIILIAIAILLAIIYLIISNQSLYALPVALISFSILSTVILVTTILVHTFRFANTFLRKTPNKQ